MARPLSVVIQDFWLERFLVGKKKNSQRLMETEDAIVVIGRHSGLLW
jgi:hypothetical protein